MIESKVKEKPTILYLVVPDVLETAVDTLSSRKDIIVKDTIQQLRLVSIETSRDQIDELNEKGYRIIDKTILNKIEPALLDQIRIKISSREESISALIDLEPYDEMTLKNIEMIKEAVVIKKYPIISSVHISFPVKSLLEIADLDYVKKINDSEGDIRPTKEPE